VLVPVIVEPVPIPVPPTVVVPVEVTDVEVTVGILLCAKHYLNLYPKTPNLNCGEYQAVGRHTPIVFDTLNVS
jgi:hypothetical protein